MTSRPGKDKISSLLIEAIHHLHFTPPRPRRGGVFRASTSPQPTNRRTTRRRMGNNAEQSPAAGPALLAHSSRAPADAPFVQIPPASLPPTVGAWATMRNGSQLPALPKKRPAFPAFHRGVSRGHVSGLFPRDLSHLNFPQIKTPIPFIRAPQPSFRVFRGSPLPAFQISRLLRDLSRLSQNPPQPHDSGNRLSLLPEGHHCLVQVTSRRATRPRPCPLLPRQSFSLRVSSAASAYPPSLAPDP